MKLCVPYIIVQMPFFLSALSFSAFGQGYPDVSKGEIEHQVFLVGDAGDDTALSSPVMELLRQKVASAKADNRSVIFLGDNIYPEGLHKKNHPSRTEDEQRLLVQLNAVKDLDCEVVFIGGNHDWQKGKSKGDNFVRRQERYIEKYLDKGNVFLPDDGCPGPEVIEYGETLAIIILDTQWWLHPHDKPRGEQDGCEVLNRAELLYEFSDLLKKYRYRNVIVATHHPLFSNGKHGGKFPLKDHLFPLTEVSSSLYVPLPVIGSIYPLYRQMLGNRQDITHPVYQNMKNNLTDLMNEYENIVYVAGHEHNLQYIVDEQTHHITSGSGSKATYLKKNRDLLFGESVRGFAVMSYLRNGDVKVEFHSPDHDEEEPLYSQVIYNKPPPPPSEKFSERVSYSGRSINVTPDSNYTATRFKQRFFGSLNRELWTTGISVPYLDLNYVKGGLSPVKKGGGMQTRSLRLAGGDGHQYVVRMIRKDATFLVEKDLRNTLAQDLVLDGIAGSHPYAAVIVPDFADAAGVYHTNPELVYVPSDSSLGRYMAEFGGSFCLFEERPDDDMSDFDSFGNSKKVVSYSKALNKIHEKPHHVVDVDYILRARLLDMFLGDWDRHDDQWRWATFKKEDRTIYRPIPRDRDQVFFKFNGLFPKIANRKWALKKFQSFDEDVRDIAGLNFNARFFDRTFLTQADHSLWISVADSMKGFLTDELIESTIRSFPEEAYAINGEDLVIKLRSRRDKLDLFADRYYHILAEEVDVVGTTGPDFFEVKRLNDSQVEVSVYPRKDGKKVKKKIYYNRIFDRDETKEIRLYGLGGNDEYKISGEVRKSILVRIVGGFDDDKYDDESKVKGFRHHTKIYDVKDDKDNEYNTSSETRLMLRNEKDAYSYNRKEFRYGKLMPLPSVGFTPDDGIFIGGGFRLVNHGFKKDPYKSMHNVLANVAFQTGAYRIRYAFDFTELIGRFNFSGLVNIDQPLLFDFYGFGNESEEVFNEDEPTIRQQNVRLNPFLRYVSRNRSHNLVLGGVVQFVSFDQSDETNELFPGLLNTREIGGFNIAYVFENLDNRIDPHRGIRFIAGSEWNHSFSDESIDFTKFSASLALYLPVRFMPVRTTLALRSGGAINDGEYEFYQANFIGGYRQFRGVRRNRFAGKNSMYNNADVRFKLLSVPNYVLPIDLGLLAHYDIARVWVEDDDSNLWHSSYGFGVFVNILDFLLLNATYSVSDVDETIVVRTNFLF